MSESSVQNENRGNAVGVVGMAPAAPVRGVLMSGPQLQRPPEPPGQAGGAVEINSVLRALRRRWLLASVFGAVLGAAAAAVVWQVIPTTYTCYSELRIRPGRSLVSTSQSTSSGGSGFQIYKQTVIKQVKDQQILLSALRDPKVSDCAALKDEPYPDLWLRNRLGVGASGTEYIRISLTANDAQSAYEIVNAVTSEFKLQVIDRTKTDRVETIENLQTLMNLEQTKLTNEKRRLREIEKQVRSSSASETAMLRQHHMEVRTDLRRRFNEITMQIVQHTLQLKVFGKLSAAAAPEEESAAPLTVAMLPEGIVEDALRGEPEYRRLDAEKRIQETKLMTSEQRFVAGHPAIAAARKALSETSSKLEKYRTERIPLIEQELLQQQAEYLASRQAQAPDTERTIREKIKVLQTQKEVFKEEMDSLVVEDQDLANAWIDREAISEAVEEIDQRVKNYQKRIYDQQIDLEYAAPPIEITHKPEVPRIPETGRKTKLAGISGLGIFCGLIALSVWLELRMRRVDTVDEVETHVGMPVMGTIPRMPGWVLRKRAGKADGGRKSYWQSVLTESVDSARTLLFKAADSEGLRAVIVVSAVGGEGKTTLSCHLATSLARSGRTVALVDFDLRRPSVARVFKLENSPGVCDYLVGSATVDEILRPSALPGLTVAVAGQMTKETAATLSGNGVTELIDELKQRFDFVIVDSSPILPVTDSLLVSQHVDAALFAIRRDVSRVAKVTAAAHRLTLLGVPLLGAVAIGLEDRTSTYGSGYGYGYGYRNYNYLKQPT